MAVILVIDDHTETNVLVCRLIRRDGHTTHSAYSGEAGLALLETLHPDLILLDEMMPGMSGMQVLAALRTMPSTATVPVVLYSALADALFAKSAIDAGATAVWLKGGIDPATIPKRIGELLAQSL